MAPNRAAAYRLRIARVIALAGLLFAGAAFSASRIEAEPSALAKAMDGRRIVLLGEVHDNPAQHRLRVEALRLLLAKGARPALAFEQFDRERQADLDRARKERPRDADYLIAQAGGASGWEWASYRPFVQLALDYDLPIVAANLSRDEAMKLARDKSPGAEPRLDVLPATFVRAHETEIVDGHCNLLPAAALPAMTRAQVARDMALAQAIRPYAGRGVVLLTGNGHARIDIGVPFWLTPDERAAAISIGVLERAGDGGGDVGGERFDLFVVTERAQRPDPCEELQKQMRPPRG